MFYVVVFLNSYTLYMDSLLVRKAQMKDGRKLECVCRHMWCMHSTCLLCRHVFGVYCVWFMCGHEHMSVCLQLDKYSSHSSVWNNNTILCVLSNHAWQKVLCACVLPVWVTYGAVGVTYDCPSWGCHGTWCGAPGSCRLHLLSLVPSFGAFYSL